MSLFTDFEPQRFSINIEFTSNGAQFSDIKLANPDYLGAELLGDFLGFLSECLLSGEVDISEEPAL